MTQLDGQTLIIVPSMKEGYVIQGRYELLSRRNVNEGFVVFDALDRQSNCKVSVELIQNRAFFNNSIKDQSIKDWVHEAVATEPGFEHINPDNILDAGSLDLNIFVVLALDLEEEGLLCLGTSVTDDVYDEDQAPLGNS